MNYKFPVDISLQECLDIVEKNNNFISVNKGDYIVFNYTFNAPETFPPVVDRETSILREMRGLVFDKSSGRVISRRFHKFFNYGEKEESKDIDLNREHYILQKLDGSMITPFLLNDKLVWGSKMGITDVSRQVEVFVKDNLDHLSIYHLIDLLSHGNTPIFEWVSRKQKIILDYPEDSLILTAIRNNSTGEYYSYKDMLEFSIQMNVPCVSMHTLSYKNVELLHESVKSEVDNEGWVVRYTDGHMVKMKSDWYVTLHKTKEYIDSEKNIVESYINNSIDDLLPLLQESDKERVTRYVNQLTKNLLSYSEELLSFRRGVMANFPSKKEFAINSTEDSFKRNYIFALWDCVNDDMLRDRTNSWILEIISKNISSNKKMENIRFLLPTY